MCSFDLLIALTARVDLLHEMFTQESTTMMARHTVMTCRRLHGGFCINDARRLAARETAIRNGLWPSGKAGLY